MRTTIRQTPFINQFNEDSIKVILQGLAWTLLFVILVLTDRSTLPLRFTMLVEAISVLFYVALVYFNLRYLIPNFLSEKNFLKYCVFLVLSVLVITPIKLLVLYEMFTQYPEAQPTILSNQNWYFLANFIVAGGSTIIKIITDWLAYQRDTQDLQTQTMQSELRFLKSQINPHFLFNTLNNLYALTLKKSDKAPEIVIKLSEMMRYMLYECNEKRVPLDKEVHYLENYLDLEKLRKGQMVDIGFEVNGRIGQQTIAPLIFIPFVENSFKHGANNHIKKGFVNIKLDIDNQNIVFFIENSKVDSLPAQTHKRSGGIGLVNVKRRLDLLYPKKYKLDIKDNPNTYAVRLRLDL